MRPKFFYAVIVFLYMMSPYFIYEYRSFSAIKQDQASLESGILNSDPDSADGDYIQQQQINSEEQNLRLQSYGYLGGAVFLILCPTIMLFYRRRITR